MYKKFLFFILSVFSFVNLKPVSPLSYSTLCSLRCTVHSFPINGQRTYDPDCSNCRIRKEQAVAENVAKRIREVACDDSLTTEGRARALQSLVEAELNGQSIEFTGLDDIRPVEAEIEELSKRVAQARVHALSLMEALQSDSLCSDDR